MAVPLPHKRFTIEEYEQLIDAGFLQEDERLELIEGEIVEMAPINLPHAVCVMRVHTLFYELTRENRKGCVWVQNPLWIPIRSRPEPDVVLLRWRDDLYASKRPETEDVILLVEVSDSTLQADRKVKMPLYARAGVREAWIVNLIDEVIEVHSDPANGRYSRTTQVGRGESLTLPDPVRSTIDVEAILG